VHLAEAFDRGDTRPAPAEPTTSVTTATLSGRVDDHDCSRLLLAACDQDRQRSIRMLSQTDGRTPYSPARDNGMVCWRLAGYVAGLGGLGAGLSSGPGELG
jgi:hypothetical protein